MRRVYGMVRDARIDAATALQKKIARGQLDSPFSERELYRKGWSLLTDPEVVTDACTELVVAGWIRRVDEPRRSGRPPSRKYEINPKCYSQTGDNN